jgi:hypothetical protein
MTATPQPSEALGARPTAPAPAAAVPALRPGSDALLALVGSIIVPPLALAGRFAAAFIAPAAALGVLADRLFHESSLGINLPIWLAATLVAVVFVSRAAGRALGRERLALLIATVGFASVVAWRDADMLLALNLLVALALACAGLARAPEASVLRMRTPDFIVAAVTGGFSLVTSVPRLVDRTSWPNSLGSVRRSTSWLSVRSLMIATPIFLVFGALFVAADDVFAEETRQLFDFDVSEIRPHVLWFALGTWLGVVALWTAAAIKQPEGVPDLPDSRRLKAAEVGVILGPLALLFGVFVAVQIRYLFGGEDAVQRSINLTYSEYARRGFFELVVASLLLLPVLAGVNWARRGGGRSSVVFGVLAAALVALLFVVMASAWQRLGIYRDAFGLTELRFYAAATLPWLAVVFVWFLAGLVRRMPVEFFPGAMLAALIAVFVLNVMNPDAIIARTNIERVEAGRRFDADYASLLSADAVPTLLTNLGRIPQADRCYLVQSLQTWADSDAGVRSWNFSRQNARAEVREAQGRLAAACP